MLAELKRQIAQLGEMNRALAEDLDRSHQRASELVRERETLLQRLEGLRAESLAARTRAEQAEEDRRELFLRLCEAEEDREALSVELDESVAALEEIHFELLQVTGEA